MGRRGLNIIDKLEIKISELIEYDNKHQCFKWFTLGFSIATLIFTAIINILVIIKS